MSTSLPTLHTQAPVSKLDFQGIRPQRFSGGRKHIRIPDTIDHSMQSAQVEWKGRKHFLTNETPVMVYRPGIKVFGKTQNSSQIKFKDTEQEVLTKLIYMPPQKRIPKGSIQINLKPIQSPGKPRISQQEKEERERKLQDKKCVEDLDAWEDVNAKRRPQ